MFENPPQVPTGLESATRFQILSLDGGGIKGLYSAAVLAGIEDDLGVKVTDHFDLLAGTSTGGIIALGLGLGLRPREIVEFYVAEGPKIFRKISLWTSLRRCWRSKYPQEPLKEALHRYFGGNRLAESKKRLVIPSYDLDRDQVYLFKTPHHPDLKRDWKMPMWKVALATSAAPTYFPCCRDVDGTRLVDGGMWANNPTIIGIAEASSMLGVRLNAIASLSIGTTNNRTHRRARLDNGGLLHWCRAGLDVAMRGQSHGVQGQAQHLLGKERAIRLDPVVPEGLFELDRLSERDLLSWGAHVSRHSGPMFQSTFMPHLAPVFIPLYTEGFHDPAAL